MKRYALISLILLAMFLVACAPATEEITTVLTTAVGTVEVATDDNIETTPEELNITYNGPEWASIQLTDARTGETFTLSDFAGKVVMVEPMATWCSNCRQQQGNLRSIYTDFDDNDVVFISMSVENNLENIRLAEYADDNQFNWTFIVATPELLSALTNQFGRTITNPPATPRFFIDADGTVSNLITGFHNSQAIVDEVNAYLNS